MSDFKATTATVCFPIESKSCSRERERDFHVTLATVVPFGNTWQDEEHPEVNAKDKDNLEYTLPKHSLPQVNGPVHYHGAKLNQKHHQEGFRDLVFRQGFSYVSSC